MYIISTFSFFKYFNFKRVNFTSTGFRPLLFFNTKIKSNRPLKWMAQTLFLPCPSNPHYPIWFVLHKWKRVQWLSCYHTEKLNTNELWRTISIYTIHPLNEYSYTNIMHDRGNEDYHTLVRVIDRRYILSWNESKFRPKITYTLWLLTTLTIVQPFYCKVKRFSERDWMRFY